MEEEAKAGCLHNVEIFLFTDNSMAESCFYRGSSTSPLLPELMLRLQKLKILYNLQIHLIHISGKQMIVQGTDGCACGCGFMRKGVMTGQNMLSFVDLAMPATE